MPEVRTPRDLGTREHSARMVYQPPSSLPEPAPQDGWVFRWVATHVLGQADPANVSKRLREGWEPCKSEDHPEMALLSNSKGNIEVGGLMLCKMPAELAQSRDTYYATQTARQMQSVDSQLMSQNDDRMPLFNERKSEVRGGRKTARFGNGS